MKKIGILYGFLLLANSSALFAMQNLSLFSWLNGHNDIEFVIPSNDYNALQEDRLQEGLAKEETPLAQKIFYTFLLKSIVTVTNDGNIRIICDSHYIDHYLEEYEPSCPTTAYQER